MTASALHQRARGLTICIPNWNHSSFLARSILSAKRALAALRQQDVKGEILVIDDHSRDGSQRTLATIAAMDPDDVIDVILCLENKGLAAARNLALRDARFSHVCFLDADNEILPSNLPIFWLALEMTDATVIFGNLIGHDGTNAIKLLSNCYVHDEIYEYNYIDAFAIYDARALLSIGGFDEALTSHEDWEMMLHILAEDKDAVFVPICLGFYYIVPYSMVQTETFKHARMRRIFSQRRPAGAANTRPRRMFHPDIGWL